MYTCAHAFLGELVLSFHCANCSLEVYVQNTKPPRSGKFGPRANCSGPVLRAAGLLRSHLPGADPSPQRSSFAAPALGRGGGLGACRRVGDNLRVSSPRRGPGLPAIWPEEGWGCGDRDPPERAKPVEKADPPLPSARVGQVNLADAGRSWVGVPLSRRRMRLAICTLLCAGALGEWHTGMGGRPALQAWTGC